VLACNQRDYLIAQRVDSNIGREEDAGILLVGKAQNSAIDIGKAMNGKHDWLNAKGTGGFLEPLSIQPTIGIIGIVSARPWRRFGSKNPKARAAYTPTRSTRGKPAQGVKGAAS
jgi:hypothetical protein